MFYFRILLFSVFLFSFAHAIENQTCYEPLLLIWNGPFQPTGGANEDSNSPLSFLHGLWYHVNNLEPKQEDGEHSPPSRRNEIKSLLLIDI